MRYLVFGEFLLVVVGLLEPGGEGGQPGIPLLYLAGQLTDTRLQAVQLGPAGTETQALLHHRVHIFTRDETGLLCLPTQLERTLQLNYW